MRTILITGGCGFIGSHFIRYVLENYPEERVVNFDKLTYAGNLGNVRDIEQKFANRYRFIQGDIAEKAAVEKIFAEEKLSRIVNLAAETHVDRSIHDPEVFLRTNVFGLYVLLEAAKQFGIERFLHVSTDEVYGIAEGDRQFREDDRLGPRSPYAASKAAGDLVALAYYKTYGVPAVITRGSNAYGPNQYPEKFLALAITNLLEGKKIPVYPPGIQVREWTHVLDHVTALDLVFRRGEAGEVYNFGSGERRRNLDMARTILSIFGKNDEDIDFIDARPGHDARYALDSSKIRSLSWGPNRDLNSALPELVEWYRKNESWWKPLKSDDYLEYYKKQYKQP